MLKDSGLPFVLLLDGVDPLHPFVANSLLESFLYGPKQQPKRKEDTLPPVYNTDPTKLVLYSFGQHIQQATKQRLNRVVATCRCYTLTKIAQYDVQEKMKLKREYLKQRTAQRGTTSAATPATANAKVSVPSFFDTNSFEDFENQWRVFRLEPLKGDREEDHFMKAVTGQWGLGVGEDAQSRILLALLNERKQTILPPNQRTALSLLLLTRDVVRTVSASEAARATESKEEKEGVFFGEDGFPGVSNSQYEVMDHLVEDFLKHNLEHTWEGADNEEERRVQREKRLLLSAFAFLVFWWDEHMLHFEPDGQEGRKQNSVSQKDFVNTLLGVYYKNAEEEKASTTRDYYDEVLKLLPGCLLCEYVAAEQRVVFKHRPLHQFLVGEFVSLWYYIANRKTRAVDRLGTKSADVAELPSLEDMKRFSAALTQHTTERRRVRSLWREPPKIVAGKESPIPGMHEGMVEVQPPLMAWEGDAFIAHAWWAEVLVFVSFNIAFNEDESYGVSSNPSPTQLGPNEAGSATVWLFNRLIGQRTGDTLMNWLVRLRKYGTGK